MLGMAVEGIRNSDLQPIEDTPKPNANTMKRFTERIKIYGIYIKGVWQDIHICKMRGGSVCTRDRASGKHEKRQRERDSEKQKIQYN